METTTQPRPPMWLSLPPGFFPTSVLEDGERAATVAALTEGLSERAADVVAEAMDVAQRQAEAQRRSGLSLSASGVHPRADGGVDLSTLVAGVVRVPSGPPAAVLLAVARAEEARPETAAVRVLDLPAGPAVVAERHLEVTPAEAGVDTTAAGGDGSAGWAPVWAPVGLHSVRVTFAAPGGSHLAVVELTTKASDAFDSYRDVMLELVAPSVTFEDPTSPGAAATAGAGSRLADRLGGRTVAVDRGEGAPV